MAIKKKKSSGGGSNWMDTYGDMVTLLLCFFVLLYSMSTLDKDKIIQLVRAFNPQALIETEQNFQESGDNEDPVSNEPGMTQGEVEQALEQLAQQLQAVADEQAAQAAAQGGQNTQNGMAVTLGDGYVYIALNDAVFFEGYSSVLLNPGKGVLDQVGAMLAQHAEAINEIRVLGHTARDVPERENDPVVDRTLSAGRASSVLVYLQPICGVDPARMVSMGFGEWRPVASNATSEERAKNRRVELIVSGITVGQSGEDAITQYYTESGNTPPEDGPQVQPQAPAADGTPAE